jgi:pimeloyl-ACP methyl ester carboxylesterase
MLLRGRAAAYVRQYEELCDGHGHDQGRHGNLLQRLGYGEPIFFHHGWPLSADDWDAQMMFFLGKGYRVIAHDRRGHGRSSQTATGHDMDTYADDAFEVVKKLDLKNAVTSDIRPAAAK